MSDLLVITPDDWADFRAIRLRALADAPDAFGATLTEARAAPDALWRERAGGPGPLVLSYDDAVPAAMGGLFVPDGSAEAFVWGMWTAPEARGRGLASGILRELLIHAEVARRAVSLHVTEGNDAARRLYETHGFVATGEREPLRVGSAVRIELMRLEALVE